MASRTGLDEAQGQHWLFAHNGACGLGRWIRLVFSARHANDQWLRSGFSTERRVLREGCAHVTSACSEKDEHDHSPLFRPASDIQIHRCVLRSWQGFFHMNLHEHALFPFDTLTPNGPFLYESLYYPNAGLAAARARGRIGGRPRKLATNGKVALAQRLFADKKHAIDDICSTLGISRSTSTAMSERQLLQHRTRELKGRSSLTQRVISFQVLPQIIVKKLPDGILAFTNKASSVSIIWHVILFRQKNTDRPVVVSL
jgi:hypothetical protein